MHSSFLVHLDNELRNDHNIPGFCGDIAPIIAIRSTSFTPTTTSPAQWRHCLEGIKFEEDTFILTGFIRDESQIQIRKSFIWQPIRRWPEQECGAGIRGKATLVTEKPPPITTSANVTLNLACIPIHPSSGYRVTSGWGDKSVYPTGDQEYGSGIGGDQTPRPLPHRANFLRM